MRSRSCIGIDLGTFHTVAVQKKLEGIVFPSRSIPSIAVMLGKVPVVGVDAIQQIDLPNRMIIAPKLKLHDQSESKETISIILRKLVEQSIQDLGANVRSAVMTVPPGWTLDDCMAIRESVSVLGLELSFLHEPIALLSAVTYLSRKGDSNPLITGLLATSEKVLVCDWGAGTVDLALVQLLHKSNGFEYRCLGESTILGEGGTNIALDIVGNVDGNSDLQKNEKTAFRLQSAWQGFQFSTFKLDNYKSESLERRRRAANKIATATSELLERLCIDNRSEIVTLLHGGPLESKELRSALEDELSNNVGLSKSKFFTAGTEFTNDFTGIRNIRRDCLVAAGASIYGADGEALPEFEYEIILKDSFGKSTSTIRLIKGKNLAGIQVITPPFSGVDYFVEVHQVTTSGGSRERTPISAELKLFVRKGAVVMYRIADAGVGFATIEAAEAQDLPSPELYIDSRIESVVLPEKSTRFLVNFE